MDIDPKVSNLASIKISKLCYKTSSHRILNNLDTCFYPGITALIGANGSGKSTLLKILAGQLLPTQGQVTYQGIQGIDYVPSQNFLYHHLTVYENFKLITQLDKLTKTFSNNRIFKVLQQFKLEELSNVLFSQLSDGLKKRVCFASQLLKQANVLILDEPCSGLDPLQRQQLWQSLLEQAQQQRIIVVASHHPHEIQAICQQCVILHQGKLFIDKKFNQQPSPQPLNEAIVEAQPC